MMASAARGERPARVSSRQQSGERASVKRMSTPSGGENEMEQVAELERRRRAVDDMYEAFVEKGAWSAPEVSASEAARMFQEASDGDNFPALTFVDVRSAEERRVSIIPGAIDKYAFERAIEDDDARASLIGDSKSKIICYCTIGYRSGKYVESMLEKHECLRGHIFNLRGSILSWTHQGMPLEEGGDSSSSGSGRGAMSTTTTVHVFGETWRLQHPAYNAVTFKNLTYASKLLGAFWSYSFAPIFDWVRSLVRLVWSSQ